MTIFFSGFGRGMFAESITFEVTDQSQWSVFCVGIVVWLRQEDVVKR
jgi:hypothetical protein